MAKIRLYSKVLLAKKPIVLRAKGAMWHLFDKKGASAILIPVLMNTKINFKKRFR